MAATYRERRGWLPPSSAFNADLLTQINRVSRELAKESCVKGDKGLLYDWKAVNSDQQNAWHFGKTMVPKIRIYLKILDILI